MAALRGSATGYTPPTGRVRLNSRTANVRFRPFATGDLGLAFGPVIPQTDLRFTSARQRHALIRFGGLFAALDGSSAPYSPAPYRGRYLLGRKFIPQTDLDFTRPALGNTDIPFGFVAGRVFLPGSSDPYTPPQYRGTALLGQRPAPVRTADLAGTSDGYRVPRLDGRAWINSGATRRAALQGNGDAYELPLYEGGIILGDPPIIRVLTLAGRSDAYRPLYRDGRVWINSGAARRIRLASEDLTHVAGFPFNRVYLPHIAPDDALPPVQPLVTRNAGNLTGDGAPKQRPEGIRLQNPRGRPRDPALGYRDARTRADPACPTLRQARPRQEDERIVIGDARDFQSSHGLALSHAARREDIRRIVLDDNFRHLRDDTQLRTNHAPRRDYRRTFLWDDAPHRRTGMRSDSIQAPWQQRCWRIVIGDGDAPFWRWPPVVIIEPPVEPPIPELEPDRDLDFTCLVPLIGAGQSVLVRFGDAVCIPPIRTVYLVSNTITVHRLPGGEPIRVSQISLETDRESWGWRAQLTIADAASANLLRRSNGGPHTVEISINGYTWHILIEGLADTRKHAQQGWTVRGRSPLALLTEPYAPVATYTEDQARTAQQLINQELIGTGWTLDWQATDWLIPGDTFTYTDKTPVSAIRQIVEAFGGTMRAARAQQILTVHDRYPVADPWDWATATPTWVLNADTLAEESRQERPGPGYRGIYVSGQANGVLANVRRDGTNGTPYAPTFVHPLITEAAAARQKGRAVIGEAGSKLDITISGPLLPFAGGAVPLFEIGDLIEMDNGLETYRAQVEQVGVTASRDGRAVAVTQRAGLEQDVEDWS
ncbi:MAG: hypothetical protein ABF296_09390 [Oceanococcaceae bacterium]